MLSVAPDRDVEHQPAKHFATAIRDYLFKMPDINLDKLPQTMPEDFVKAFSNEQQLRQSLQLLIIMPYLSGKLHNDDVQRVDEYAQAANLSPGSLQDLNNLVNNRIKKALINYTRRGTNEFLPGSPVQKLKSIVREIHSLVGDKKELMFTNNFQPLKLELSERPSSTSITVEILNFQAKKVILASQL
jgi:hypothetical protein